MSHGTYVNSNAEQASTHVNSNAEQADTSSLTGIHYFSQKSPIVVSGKRTKERGRGGERKRERERDSPSQ